MGALEEPARVFLLTLEFRGRYEFWYTISLPCSVGLLPKTQHLIVMAN